MRLLKEFARELAGLGSFVLSLCLMGILAIHPALASNDLFKMLAQAIIVQGLIGLTMSYYFTASPRKKDEEEG